MAKKIEVKLAPPEVVEQRKRKIEEEAAQHGHRIGNWQFFNDDYPHWKGVCQNAGCNSTVTGNPAVNGIFIGITATSRLTKCPYDRSKMFGKRV